MPTVTVRGKTLTCDYGANLRKVLLEHDIDLYNGKAKIINCRGIGSCGTCAVQIEGDISESNWKDRFRRSLPPHSPQKNRRLACPSYSAVRRRSLLGLRQTKVLGDICVTKYNGFWGQGDEIVGSRY